MSETVQSPVSPNGSAPGPTEPRPPSRPTGDPVGFFDRPWVTRSLTVVGLALAVAIFAYGCQVGESADGPAGDPVIVEQFPPPGGRALRQTEVGAHLALGYDGRLVVDGIAIPEEQMEGALDPDDPANRRNVELYGPRMNNRHRVVFRPGPDKVIEEFAQGEVQITLRYFPAGRQETEALETSWTVTVS